MSSWKSTANVDAWDGQAASYGSSAGGVSAARKGKARERERFGSSPISRVPLEVLTHIFAQLPPQALGVCQLVCKVWNEVVSDEGSWRTAFETYYLITTASLGRRIEPLSWRAEYIARVALLRQWHRSRTPTVIHNPSLGAISSIYLHLPSPASPVCSTSRPYTPRRDSLSPNDITMISTSLDLGVAVHSAPFTGKVSKRPLLSSPIDHLGRPVGLPILAATSCAISLDGTKLVWGMRDGSLRFSNSSSTGGRGAAGGTLEQGEVRALENVHREGTPVQLLSFSNAGGTGAGKVLQRVKQRTELFVSVGRDGTVAVWSTIVPPAAGARERAPPAVRIWHARWDVSVMQQASATAPHGAAAIAREWIQATAIAFDSGWLSRHHGRPASIAVGRSDGKVVVWPEVDLPELPGVEVHAGEPEVLDVGAGQAIDTLVLDPPSSISSSLALLVHHANSDTFSRYTFPSSTTPSRPHRTLFGHPLADHLGPLTAFAVDFDSPRPLPLTSQPATPGEGVLSFPTVVPSVGSASLNLPPLSTIPSTGLADSTLGSNQFGRRKFVVAGDGVGRVFLWDWEADVAEEGANERIVEPVKMVQGLEIEGGGSASKITALELTEAGAFVGSVDGTLRFYSTLGPSHTPQPPIRSFRDRSAPRHPSRMLAQGLVAEDDEERWLVSHIRANKEAVVAAIGGRVLAWRTSSDVRRKAGTKANGGKLTARQERFKANLELQHQVRESMSALSAESAARVERHEEEHRLASQFGLPPTLENLTEEEAVALAMMLSADEEEARLFGMGTGHGTRGSTVASDSEWELAPDDWLADEGVWLDEDYDRRPSTSGTRTPAYEVEEEDDYASQTTSRGGGSRAQSLSTSLTVPSSPFLRGSSLAPGGTPSPSPRSFSKTWKPASAQSSSPSLTAPGSVSSPSSHFYNPHAKVQVSPRLGPTYGSPFASYANDVVPDMDPALWPIAATSSSPSARRLSATLPSSLTSAVAASPAPTLPPLASSSSSTPASPTLDATATPIRRGWSDVARTSAASPSTSSSASPSPWGAHRPSPPPSSLLADQLRSHGGTSSRDEGEERRRRKREEDDLQFAIELSLAEEASRLEI
ncbi:hypothetical protein JCM1841_001162 [Sporobolomyces salmonicolor]